MKKIFQILLCVFCFQLSNAQEPLTHNFNSINPYLFNPAATGSDGSISAFFDVYNQWTSFSQSPRIYTFGIHSPITDKMSLGFMLLNDKRSVYNHFNGMINYSYKVNFKKDMGLVFGLGFGVVNHKIDFSQINPSDPGDPLYNTTDYNKSNFALGTGLLFNYKALKVHFSLPQLLEKGEYVTAKYNLVASYTFEINDQLALMPSVFMRGFRNNAKQEDINLMAIWKRNFWGQLGYRTDKSLLASAGVQTGSIGFAYCYQANTGELRNFSDGAHEIMLSYRFGKGLFKAKTFHPALNDRLENSTTPNIVIATVQKEEDRVVANAPKQENVEAKAVEIPSIALEPKIDLPVVPKADTVKIVKNNVVPENVADPIIPVEKIKKEVFVLGPIKFRDNKSSLKAESLPALDKLKAYLLDHPSLRFEIAGHTDNVGNAIDNNKLSYQRARSCVNYLVSKGIAKNRLVVKGYGETKPLVPNTSARNRAVNRRVEAKIIEKVEVTQKKVVTRKKKNKK